MNMKKISMLMAICGVLVIGACSQKTEDISRAESAELVTAQLSSLDFERMAKAMLDDMLMHELSGNRTFIMEVGEVRNDTMQRINTADLTDYMRRELRRSGKVTVTNLGENASVASSRDLANNSIMNQSTTMQKGTVTAANTSLFGRISQRDLGIDKGRKKIEYTFSLSLTDLRNGTEIWSNKEVITRLTNSNTKTW
ncbi:MAG: penicillin-binding protein activator LpoB [Alphaproteobacteria bacterium]|nr:penicillin-binding protein activator LpoB [Alphaproteobacteria bacterium]